MKLKKIYFIFIAFVILFSTKTFALETEWGIQYSVTPEYPQPGDTVLVKIKSYSMDLNSSNISYLVNDELKESGIGLKSFILKIPKNNNKIKIDIIAKNFDDKILKKEFFIKPNSVDLTYEIIDPYRPPFYKGKSTILSNSKLKVYAFPNLINDLGKKIDPKTLIYIWKINNKVVRNQSGLGRDSLLIKKLNAYPRKTNVTVEVGTLDHKLKAVKSILLEPKMSNIDFYIDDKIYPFSFKSVAKPYLIEKQKNNDIVAIPYFFNDINLSEINWKINGTKINLLGGEDPLRMNIIRNKKNVAVPLRIDLSIINNNRILQSAETSVISHVSKTLLEEFKNMIQATFNKTEVRKTDNFFGN